MENGFTSPRHDAFPAGLRVLVVDDDPTWLKILEKMLKKCSYEVTTCGLARDALNLLRERKDGYDIVISDVNMPDMDGYKLLEHVGLEMDLPVIMMSVDGETSRVMKGVQNGACDYLLKPIRMKELRNIWQHVFRKRIHDLRDIEGHEGIDSLQMTRSGSDRSDDGFFFCGEDITSGKKRKDVETNHEKDFADPSSSAKKVRVVWSVDLHQKFVKAVNQIGFDKIGPKKILDLMNVPWLTRENVASHLQKYRLYLSRLQKDNDLKPCFGGIKHSDTTPQDPQASFNSQNAAVHQTDIPSGNYAFSSDGLLLQERKKAHEDDPKGIFPMPKEEPQRPLVADLPDQQESRGLQIGLKGFPHLDSEVRYRKLDPTVPTHYSWRAVPETPFKEENDAIPLADFRHLPMSGHVQVPQRKPTDPSINPQQSRTEGARTNSSDYNKPLHAGHRSKNYTQANPLRTRSGSLCVQDKAHVVNYQDFSSTTIKAGSMENVGFNLSCLTDTEFSQRNLPSISGSSFTSSNEDVLSGWLQNDAFPVNLGLHNIEFSGYNDPCFVAEAFPIGLYDPLRFDYEQLTEPTECSVLDQGLFMA